MSSNQNKASPSAFGVTKYIAWCCLLFTLLASQATFAAWSAAYFRGTPNSWNSTAMTKNTSTGLWETTQTFSGVTNPRFKISQYSTNWTVAYPASDYLITGGNGSYKITFNDTTFAITATKVLVAGTVPSTSVCYDNAAAYATPYVYYWNASPSSSVTSYPAWPGKLMTAVGSYYCFNFASVLTTAGVMPTSMGIKFSNNGNPQTADMSFTGAGCYQGGAWKTLAACGFTVTTVASSVAASSTPSSVAASSVAPSSVAASSVAPSSVAASSVAPSSVAASSVAPSSVAASSVAASSTPSSVAASSVAASSVAAQSTRIYFKNTLGYTNPYIHYFNVVPALK